MPSLVSIIPIINSRGKVLAYMRLLLLTEKHKGYSIIKVHWRDICRPASRLPARGEKSPPDLLTLSYNTIIADHRDIASIFYENTAQIIKIILGIFYI